MLEIEFTTAIKKDLKKYQYQKDILLALHEVIDILAKQRSLPSKHRDHHLRGNWINHRECHVKNDVLLIYQINDNILFLTRFGSHSELF
ncbi:MULTISPECIES: type II toxin-antitoxin system YafQ family toxin [unclassified Neochlamydia]|uniref:type II toxin-antitoxin system mRNA interferase toxin, RelE/StbE family n=1 Tax=unclassified Neochlamydia TaxID=2643326 RepID=UPI00140A6E12|nr:mRNA interferase YafQ [Neochlamydia sp. AcF84]